MSKSSVLARFQAFAGKISRYIRESKRARSARHVDPEGVELAERLRKSRLTFLSIPPLLDLRDRVRELDAQCVPGSIIEAGCALGGSAIMLAASKSPGRELRVHDVFGLIPPPSDRDSKDVHDRYRLIVGGEAKGFGGDKYYGYQENLLAKVAKSFSDFGYECDENRVTLIQGTFQETIHPDGPVALAHVDGDWYESVKVCLDRIWPFLSPGGVIVIDDYEAWSGCREAVDEFLLRHPECKVEMRSRIHLIRALPPS